MAPLLYIRREVFGLTQSEMAAIAGVTQGTVSKWEAGTLEPSRIEMQRIRDEARLRRKRWNDDWFFTVPAASARRVPTGANAA